MRDPRWRKIGRDALLHKARTLLVILAIATGLAASGTVLDSWALVRSVTHDTYLASDPASATLRIDSVDAGALAAARGVAGVRAARGRRTMMVSLRAGGTWQSAMLFASSDYGRREIGRLEPLAGAWPPPDGAIVVERSSVDFSGTTIGEPVTIAIGDATPVVAPVAGIVRDVSVAPGWMEHLVYAFVTPATLARLGGPGSLDELQILVNDRAATQEDVRRVAYRVKAALEAAGHPVRDVDVPVPGRHVHAAQMDSLLFTQGAFGLLALVVCGFLVVNLTTAMLAGQVREIGVMKTLGASPRQLARMYLAFAAALGLAAALISLPPAMRLGRSYGALRAELLNFSVEGAAIPWWAIALQVAVGVLIPVAAAWIPVRRGTRIPVAAALRDFGIDQDAAEPWMPHVPGLSRPTLLSIRNAFRKRQRMLLTLLALAAGGAVFIGAANLQRSVLGAVDLLYAGQKYDFTIRTAAPHAPDSAESVARAVPGVAAVEGWAGARATVVRDTSLPGNAFAVVAPPLGSPRLAPAVVDGRWLKRGDGNALVVSRSLAQQEPSLHVGARVTLMIGAVSAEWTVVGVVDTGPGPTAYTGREALAAVTGERRVSTLVVASRASGVSAQVELIGRVRDALARAGMPVTSSQLLEENRRVMEDHLLMVVQFLAVMGWVMIAVGGMGLASTMSLAVLERTREIGVLRAIGAPHGAILRMFQAESLAIALLSWGCALPLSVPMSLVLARAFSRVMLPVPTHYVPDVTGTTVWLGLAVTVSVVASAWPAWRASRITISRALAYE